MFFFWCASIFKNVANIFRIFQILTERANANKLKDRDSDISETNSNDQTVEADKSNDDEQNIDDVLNETGDNETTEPADNEADATDAADVTDADDAANDIAETTEENSEEAPETKVE